MTDGANAGADEQQTKSPAPDRRSQVEVLLGDILRLMECPARLDFKDLADGTLGVAMHFEGEVPGVTAGKRGSLVDSLQFLLNKAINRPNGERRWVTLGVSGFQESRPPRPAEPSPSGPRAGVGAPAPVSPPPSSPKQAGKPPATPGQGRVAAKLPEKPAGRQDARPPRAQPVDEARLEVTEDAVLTKLARSLAEKAAQLGRIYAVMLLSPEDRARMLKAAAGVPGVKLKVEGEQHWRRLVFVPEKPVAMPKKAPMPDWDDEEE